MSALTWLDHLHQTLARLRRPASPPRLAVIGVGQELRGDDAAGLIVARRLLASKLPSHILAIDSGPSPESAAPALVRFRPDLVLFVDAAQLDQPAGAIEWLDPRDVSGFSASTHSIPLSMVAEYLQGEISCEVRILGIQPESNDILAGVSAQVNQSLSEIVRELARL